MDEILFNLDLVIYLKSIIISVLTYLDKSKSRVSFFKRKFSKEEIINIQENFLLGNVISKKANF